MSQPSPRPDDEITPLLREPSARAWFEQHRAQLRRNAYGQGFLYSMLAITFVVGLVAYVIGYLLKSSATSEPFGLLADFTYTMGFALWTAAVIVVLIEIIPEAKRRQVRRALEAYEAIRLEQARAPRDEAAPTGE